MTLMLQAAGHTVERQAPEEVLQAPHGYRAQAAPMMTQTLVLANLWEYAYAGILEEWNATLEERD